METADDRLDLLLAAADDGRPVLEDGLSGEAAEGAPRPKKSKDADEKGDWHLHGADLNELALQKWAVIAAEGPEGDRQLEAIQALLRLRGQEQGAPPQVYRVPGEMSAKKALDWKQETYAPDHVSDEDRPYYLLMLGDLHHTPLELQQALASGALVGRVHFAGAAGETDLAGYAAYADKVVRYAQTGTPESAPDLLYYVAEDGTAATLAGKSRLVDPSLAECQSLVAKGKLETAEVRRIEAATVDDLLAAGARARPAVLLSVSHGLGAPRRGWPSEEDQQRRQGAMLVRPDEVLDAERMRDKPFLPGGVWFYLACLGAGTPGASVYYPWLKDLADSGAFGGSPRAVLESLPREGARPFLAAMPLAALANPQGPLAVIGHVDLAWTYGFSGTKDLSESAKSRMLEPLKLLVRGDRAGVALDKLMVSYRKANDDLTYSYQRQKEAEAQRRADPTDPKQRAHLWMLRNDLRGYVLLGDPAARLPLRKNALAGEQVAALSIPEVRSAPASPAAPPPVPFVVEILRGDEAPGAIAARAGVPLSTLWEQVAAVLGMVRGHEAPLTLAARTGVPLETLWEWVDAYRAEQRQRRR